MNMKSMALKSMAEEGKNYKEPTTTAKDKAEDSSEGEDTSMVNCHCGEPMVCKSCGEMPQACDC